MSDNFRICDSHAHIFPDKLAEKAAEAIGDFYGIKMRGAGSVSALLKSGEKIGVSNYLVCSTATKHEQVDAINTFVAAACERTPSFWGFGTIHQDFADYENELIRIKSLGLLGVKIHPDFQSVNIDDSRLLKMYEVCRSLSLPILFHVGDNRYGFSKAERLRTVAENFKDLKVIAAHLGGYTVWEQSVDIIKDLDNVYTDTSSSLFFLSPEKASRLIRKMPIERVFFGVDFPMWNHDEEYRRYRGLNLTDDENERILSKNLISFLNKE